MKIKFDLYKPTRKWGYTGIAEIPDSCNIWDKDILEVIEKNQKEVCEHCIVDRYYHCVVSLIESSDNAKFFNHMYPSTYKEI